MENFQKLLLAVAFQLGANGEAFNADRISVYAVTIASLHSEAELAELVSNEAFLMETVSANI